MFRKRLQFVGLFLILILIFISACSNQSTTKSQKGDESQKGSTSETITLTFWHGYNPVETEHFEKNVVPKFEEKYPGVKIKSVAVPYDQFYQKLITAISGGTAPDLVRADLAWVPQLAKIDALEPLDELMEDFNSYKENVFPGTLSPNKWKDHYYGLPLDTNTRVLLWNKTLFDKAGIKEPPKTLDEFVSTIEKLSEKGKTWGYAEGGTGGWNVLPLIWSAGGEITDENMTKSSGYLNSPESVSLLEKLVELNKKGNLAPSILGGGLSTADGYAQDKYAMILDGPWMVPIFKEQYPNFEVKMSLVPEGKGGSVSVVGGEDIVLFKQSKHKKEAADFIRFMLSEETQLSMAEVGQIPVLQDLAESDYMKNHPYYGIFMEQLKTAKARTPHPEWNKIDTVISEAFQLALRGDKSPKEALDEAAKKVDAILAQ
jgi:multiple sugar transport system substrate-binding protein